MTSSKPMTREELEKLCYKICMAIVVMFLMIDDRLTKIANILIKQKERAE